MGDKSGLCLWCGRWTEKRDAQGMANCDRLECIEARVHDEDCDCPDCKERAIDPRPEE